MATRAHRDSGIPIPELGAEFFIDEHGEEFLRRAHFVAGSGPRDSASVEAARRAESLQWRADVIPLRNVPESMRWDVEKRLKEILNEEEFLQLRPAQRRE